MLMPVSPTTDEPPGHVDVRIIGERTIAVRAAEAVRQVLDVTALSVPAGNDSSQPGVRIFIHATGVRDVTLTPAEPSCSCGWPVNRPTSHAISHIVEEYAQFTARITGHRASTVFQAANAVCGVLDVARTERHAAGVTLHATGVANVRATPAAPVAVISVRTATELAAGIAAITDLVTDLQAMTWYPLRAGDVVTVDADGGFGGQTYEAIGGPPREAFDTDTEAVTAGFCCPRCHRTSHHPRDVASGYCGACHDWTGDEPLLRIISEAGGLPFRAPNDTSPDGIAFPSLWFEQWDATITVIRGGQAVFTRYPYAPGHVLAGGQR